MLLLVNEHHSKTHSRCAGTTYSQRRKWHDGFWQRGPRKSQSRVVRCLVLCSATAGGDKPAHRGEVGCFLAGGF